MGCITDGVFWEAISVVVRFGEKSSTSQVTQTWLVVNVLGQRAKECNELTGLATRENTEADLIMPPRIAWTINGIKT
jgi:hypothetical protein